MVKSEIISFVATMYFALPEPRPFLSVQFSKNGDGLRALSVLNSETRSRGAKFHVRDLAFVDAVLSAASWDVAKPIVRAQFLQQNMFEKWLRDYVRGIEQVNLLPEDNLLNPLLVKPTKKADLAESIIRETLTPKLIKHFEDYGFSVSGELGDFYGLPYLIFSVRCGSFVRCVSLDCWSGVVSATAKKTAKYSGPAQAQKLIESVMEEILDEITAPR